MRRRRRNPRHPATQHRSLPRLAFLAAFAALFPLTVFAWLYPEHRDITLLALQMLEPQQRAQLDELWSAARSGHENRLCAEMGDSAQGLNPDCIDYAAWPAIAGDHSCSAQDMLNEVLTAPWVLKVAAVGAKLDAKLSAGTRRDQRINAVRRSDIELLGADPDYATRAQSNNAHFLLARPNSAIQPEGYTEIVLGPGAEINAVGTYTLYHERALAVAARIAAGNLSAADRAQAARSALADEAFALHFLEDSFAAGHVAGNWGKTAVRKGTHDYYNEHGVEETTWNGHRYVFHGDSYLGAEDKKLVATAVRDSLVQLTDALAGKLKPQPTEGQSGDFQPEAFNVCRETHFSSAVIDRQNLRMIVPIIAQTPIPALGDVPGQLPRFRSELGPFVGVSAAGLLQSMNGGFGKTQSGASGTAGLEVSLRFGIGLEGVMDESGDGLMFAGVGYRQDARAQGSSSVPGRGAVAFRGRAPFYLIPGDLLIAAPVLAIASPKTLQKMAVRAGNGGLIPWQSGIATRIGRFQFVLGREVGINWYRLNTHNPMVLPAPGVAPLNTTLVAASSMQFDFPILEYRPFRAFSLNQTSSVLIQFYGGFDTPTGISVVSPMGAPTPDLRTIGLVGIRVAFDWRYY